ncbi:uncharacterized protein SCHCODRAFT_02746160 [Schizophyllum commune H4-8]|uniref:Protein kinase domain-containing protein n=1 Tax=Schizophyllum commune (strain H4-8 / FGSC 9210) TaxID=578458 RepID=D8Q2U1_SCHCM|nr:uncharacterized protein SCHCODRAFT_02746160 [Schizophyllum commune H4-8]KAI5894613.1 hypothetical protein SCHCODRAFT_02746160 [Schizophyllum commune H4-8]
MAIKRSSLPDQVNLTARLPRHPFNTHVLGHHDYMEQIYTNEFSGGAIVKGVNDLHAVLFPKDDFPAQLKPASLRRACVARGLYDDVQKCWTRAPDFSIPSQEPAIAKFFEEILEICRSLLPPSLQQDLDKRYWTSAFRNDTLPGGVIDRRPDVVELALNLDQIWENSYSDAQIKSSSRDTEAAAKQLHDGALNCLSTQDNRLYHIGLGVIQQLLFLSCYDRCGCVRSRPIDIHAKPEVFLWALAGLSLLPKVHLGFDMSITRDDLGHRIVTVQAVEYIIVQQLNQHISIHGRGTVVWHCKKVKGGQDVAIKSVWIDTSRAHNEIDVLKLANSKNVPNVPTLAGHENVKRMGVNASTATFRAQVCTPDVLDKIEVREYVRFVMEQYGSPLGTFASTAELLSVVLDGVEGHFGLYKKCDFIHGDIHEKNILIKDRERNKFGLRRGLLVDFESAWKIGENARDKAAKGLRSCPASHMSCGYLTRYEYRDPTVADDLESFFYVLLWPCVLQEGPDGKLRTDDFDLMSKEMGKWLSSDMRVVGCLKKDIMQNQPGEPDIFRNFLDDHVHPYFAGMKDCLCELRSVVMRRDPPPTHQDVIDVLQRHLRAHLPSEHLPHHPNPSSNEEDTLSFTVDSAKPSSSDIVRPDQGAPPTRPSDDAPEIDVHKGPWQPQAAATKYSKGVSSPPTTRTGAKRTVDRSTTRRGTRQSNLKRTAEQATDSESGFLYQRGCTECLKKVREGEPGSIKCNGQGCDVKIFHRECVKDFITGPDSSWICDGCSENPGRAQKKSKNQSATDSKERTAKSASKVSKSASKTSKSASKASSSTNAADSGPTRVTTSED